MKVSHVVESIDRTTGGLATCLSSLSSELALSFDNVIHTLSSECPIDFDEKVKIIGNKENFPVSKMGISFDLNRSLVTEASNLVHAHGLWKISTHSAVSYASTRGIPVILSPHGMLEPGALEFSSYKKRVASALWQKRDISNATCIHVTSKMEADNCKLYGVDRPIAIIPNGITQSDYPLKPVGRSRTYKKRTMLFLSRIHEKKGLDFLLKCWSKLSKYHLDWRIIIAGTDEGGCESRLKKLADQLALSWTDDVSNELATICFMGPVFGQQKISMYHEADLFVLPTRSENFGMVVVEALSCGTPVLTTKGAPWSEIDVTKSGWWIDVGEEPLLEALSCALSTSSEMLHKMGLRGHELVKRNYSVESSSKQMIKLYQWCLGKESIPEFVI